MKFNEKLIHLRKQKGLSQDDLAAILDVSRQSIYKWESGMNMPDINKLEKLTSVFEISFDYLLNENNDKIKKNAPTEQAMDCDSQNLQDAESEEKSKSADNVNLRSVFVSEESLSAEQASFEHGYAPSQKRRIKHSDKIFEESKKLMEAYIQEKGYVNVIFPQQDLCFCYFENKVDKTFGFYFDGAEQFVCPFENYVDYHLSDDGYGVDYTSIPVRGASVGVINSFTLGKTVEPTIAKPKQYTLSILYLDKSGETEEYKIEFNCFRNYKIFDFKDPDDIPLWTNFLSDFTSKNINNIITKLKIVKIQGNLIKSSETHPDDIDVELYEKKQIEALEKSKSEKQKIINNYNDYIKRKKRKRLITIASIAAIIAVFIMVLRIKSCQEENAIAEEERLKEEAERLETQKQEALSKERAKNIISLINSIETVELSDKELFKRIDEEYAKLTQKEKHLVTNYPTYTVKKAQFEPIYLAPTKAMIIDDLCGEWQSGDGKTTIKISNSNTYGIKAVWVWTKQNNDTYYWSIPSDCPSSYFTGYNSSTYRMTGKLSRLSSRTFVNFETTKSTDGLVTLYIGGVTFKKVAGN